MNGVEFSLLHLFCNNRAEGASNTARQDLMWLRLRQVFLEILTSEACINRVSQRMPRGTRQDAWEVSAPGSTGAIHCESQRPLVRVEVTRQELW